LLLPCFDRAIEHPLLVGPLSGDRIVGVLDEVAVVPHFIRQPLAVCGTEIRVLQLLLGLLHRFLAVGNLGAEVGEFLNALG
jgi:hypothetical protein